MAHYRTKLEKACRCGRSGCSTLLPVGARATIIGGTIVCDYCGSKARETARHLGITVAAALRRLPRKLPAKPQSLRERVTCSRAGCTEVILEGEIRPSIGRYVVCPGCYGSAWHRAKRKECALLEAFLSLPRRRHKPKRRVKRVSTKCARNGCWTVLRAGERRILIGKIWPVCVTCHGAIAEHARTHGQSIVEAFHLMPARKRRPPIGRVKHCQRSGCRSRIRKGNKLRVGNLVFCKSCASMARKLAKKLSTSIEQAGIQLPAKRQLRVEKCNREGCTRVVGNGVDRRIIGKKAFCRSCGNTIARMAKRLEIPPEEAIERLQPKAVG